jgi:hypothetical protein
MRAVHAAALPMHAQTLSERRNQMDIKQGNLLESLKEIQKFLDEHQAELPGVSDTGMRKQLDKAIADLKQLAATQTANDLAAKSVTRKLGMLSETLIEHRMAAVARIAAVALPPGPEIAPLSKPKANQTRERLVALARGMAREAKKFESTFVEAGLPLDFIAQLDASADQLAELLSERKQRTADRGAATKLLDTQIQEARRVVRVLDSFVKTAARDNEMLLVTWKILKRPSRSSFGTAAPTPTPTPTPTLSAGAA